jgi:hypothetical protein
MRIEAPTSDGIATGSRQAHVSAPGKERTGKQDRCTDTPGKCRIGFGGLEFGRMKAPCVIASWSNMHSKAS